MSTFFKTANAKISGACHILAVVFTVLLFVKLFFAYKLWFPQTLLLAFDITVSIFALAFIQCTIWSIKWLEKHSKRLLSLCGILPLAICVYIAFKYMDIAGISEYLGIYSAYLGVITCLLQMYDKHKNQSSCAVDP